MGLGIHLDLPEGYEDAVNEMAKIWKCTVSELIESFTVENVNKYLRKIKGEKMDHVDCKNLVVEDVWNENLGCYQKVGLCSFTKVKCQGNEELCSKYDKIEVKPEIPEKKEETTEEKKPEETTEEKPKDEE